MARVSKSTTARWYPWRLASLPLVLPRNHAAHEQDGEDGCNDVNGVTDQERSGRAPEAFRVVAMEREAPARPRRPRWPAASTPTRRSPTGGPARPDPARGAADRSFA